MNPQLPDLSRSRLALGLGCDRGTAFAALDQAIDAALTLIGAERNQIAVMATIDRKADELGLIELAAHYQWPVYYYSAAQLAQVTVSQPSETVRHYMQTPSVSAAAALLAAHAGANNTALQLEKYRWRAASGHHVTVSIAAMTVE
ncbi:cobalamin biosynthesis protein [Rhodoferax sp. 4810]|uniref:Cobalamin biosynthesis protein n=1 Tax=Thiospirillum jenense TaxID=1653858 RepID=A0A839HDA0_9GAMM|nr:cobalamin biosynthesis protein [Thiospirillum jenense]MBB1073061.1 cobalamin biosynthesis protein [Rhodoferax jenense]MBB1125009.1 cobalamin biosynthesis protein [Thiospirillum jenense]